MHYRSYYVLSCALAAVFAFGASSRAATNVDTAADPDKAKLPVSQIVLYSSGVGFFDRAGEIDGNKSVELRFKAEEVNDLLKSMVVQDFSGGTVSTVTYDSRDPITKTLKSFGLDLTDNPSQGALLNQARGERVELFWPGKLTGTIVGVEKRQEPAGEIETGEKGDLNPPQRDGV